MKRKRLMELRKDKNMNHAEVAEAVGIDRSYYTYIENGERDPNHEIMKKLADFFSATVDDIFFSHQRDEMSQRSGTV